MSYSQHALSFHDGTSLVLRMFGSPHGVGRVAAVTERTGLSARRFIEVFRREVGLTPKVYCRVSRFRAAVSAVASTPVADWAATASACGYFDQAHFIHEFREFSGMSPSAYIRHRTASPNHVRLPG